MVMDVIDYCKKFKSVFIYGSGIYGRMIYLYLQENGVKVRGFIVSEYKSDVREVLGCSVFDKKVLARLDNNQGIIIALNKKFSMEVESSLKEFNICDYYKLDDESVVEELLLKLKFRIKYPTRKNIIPLIYHRVGDIGIDSRKLSIDKILFTNQIRYLRDNYKIIRADEEWNDNESTSIVITFDDGYYDFYYEVLPIIEKLKVPVTIFISTMNIDLNNELWGDILEQLIFNTKKTCFTFRNEKYKMMFHEDKIHVMFDIRNILKNTNSSARNAMLSELKDCLNVNYSPRPSNRIMTSAEIKQCSQSPYVTIGAHTESHCSLAFEDTLRQYDEMNNSKQVLEKITGRKVELFAYPYGMKEDYDGKTIKIAKEIGFKKIFSACPGMTNVSYVNGEIPRNSISQCKDMNETIRRLKFIETVYADDYI